MKQKRHSKKYLAGLLALLLCFPTLLNSCGDDEKTDETTTARSDSTVTTEKKDSEQSQTETLSEVLYRTTGGKPIARAGFSNGIGKTVATAYALQADTGTAYASFSTVWTSSKLTFTVNVKKGDTVTLVANDFTKTETAESDTVTIEATPEAMGIRIADLGQNIPLSLTVKNSTQTSTFDGFVELGYSSSLFISDCSTSSVFKTKATILNSSEDTTGVNAGAKISNGTMLLFNKYSPALNPTYLCATATVSSVTGLANTGINLFFDCDITVQSMPVSTISFKSGDYAEGFSVLVNRGDDSFYFGIINTEEGLLGYVNDGTQILTSPLGVDLGEAFHLTAYMEKTGNVTLSVNGYEVATFEGISCARTSTEKATITLGMNRSASATEDGSQDASVLLDNLSLSQNKATSVADLITINTLFGKGNDVIKADADNTYYAPEELFVSETVTSKVYNISETVYWKSSDDAIISTEGKITSPTESGEFVTLTMYLTDGKYVVTEKTFAFFVKGQAADIHVLSVKGDTDPAIGVASGTDTAFTFNKNDNSLVYDMGSVTAIRSAKVTVAGDDDFYLPKASLSLYASNDNKNYSLIENFTVLFKDNTAYFYNFDVNARYLKIHVMSEAYTSTTLYVNSLQRMAVAYSDNKVLADTTTYASKKALTVKSTGSEETDRIVTFSLSDLGLSAEKTDIVFVGKDGDIYPHYYMSGTYYVRLFTTPASGNTTVTAYYGNSTAMNLSNPEETFEISYGSKVAWATTTAWRNSVAEMPDGSLLMIGGTANKKGGLYYERSTDGGRTWSTSVSIPNTDYMLDGGAFLVDKANGKVFYFGYANDASAWTCSIYIICSTDSGMTWGKPVVVTGQPQYSISYSDGITLSCADGTGSNVDYVFTCACSDGTSGKAFFCTGFYSKDGGKTWKTSKSKVTYGSTTAFEGGVLEDCVYEQEDGTLIMYARCQVNGANHFAVSHSYDHGVTWTEVAVLSNVYAPNTQPIIETLNGVPTLLWGGNNILGSTSYKRCPLNLAYSEDDGETFTGILDVLSGTIFENLDNSYPSTNPDIVFFTHNGILSAYIISTDFRVLIRDVENYLYKTKGSFDSFEHGTALDEGWATATGTLSISETGATDGEKALCIGAGAIVSRSIPYTTEGTISFDLNIEELTAATYIEFQSAFSTSTKKAAPVTLRINTDKTVSYTNANGVYTKTSLTVVEGQNNISLTFNGTTGKATLTVNGQSTDIVFNTTLGTCVCFVTLWNKTTENLYIDRFIVR